MTSEQYLRVGELYHAAMELAPEARVEFLAGACGSDDELRREVESLLQARQQADGFIAGKMAGVVAVMAAQQQTIARGPQLWPLSSALVDWRGRDGRSLSGRRHAARSQGRAQAVARRIHAGSGARAPLQAGSARGLQSQPSQHPHHSRDRRSSTAEGGAHYIVTEFVEGETLRAMLRGGRLEIGKAAAIAEQIASALSVAHEAGIVHRDIKPENVMVRPDGLVKVLDFGLAKLTELPQQRRRLIHKRRRWPG